MISAIVLAAGYSTRMGQLKALLDWGGESLVSYQVRQLREAGVDEVIVVLGHRSDEIRRTMKDVDCRVMVNPRAMMGRSGSLRIGAKAVSRDADAIVVINVDQPRPAAFLKPLIAAFDPAKAGVRPVRGGKHGHPVVLAGRLRGELMQVDEEHEGMLAVIREHASEIADIETDDLLHLDMNTPEEYAAAKSRFGLK